MRTRLSAMVVCVSLITVMSLQVASAQKSSNLSTVWTLHNSGGERIYGDVVPEARYVDGERGVSAVIWTTGTRPTYDAVLQVARPRAVVFDFFGSWLGGCVGMNTRASLQPWMNASAFSSAALINIKSVLDPNRRGEDYSFETRLVLQILNAPDGRAYNARMTGCPISPDPDPDSPDYCPVSCANGPLDIICTDATSTISVHHVPATGSQPEHWDVGPVLNGDSAVSNLLDANKFGTVTCASVSWGQFDLPFFIRIDARR